MASLSQVNLQKQTVAQLTALCREHKLSGYSKLKKAALIEKLETHRNRSNNASVANIVLTNVPPSVLYVEPGTSNTVLHTIDAATTVTPGKSARVQATPRASAPQVDIKDNETPLEKSSDVSQATHANRPPTSARDSRFIPAAAPPPSPISRESLSVTKTVTFPLNAIVSEKRKRSAGQLPDLLGRAPKKRLLNPLSSNSLRKAPAPTFMAPAVPERSAQLPGTAKLAAPQLSLRDVVPLSKRRFVPLKQKPILVEPANAHAGPASPPSVGIFQHYVVRAEYNALLSNITVPPSLSQRKYVKGLALILRDLRDPERIACSLANRTLRYAGEAWRTRAELLHLLNQLSVYVSAQFILSEEFPGRRTEKLLARAHDCFTNLWPYLNFRRKEKTSLKLMYQSSFLSRYAPHPMSERVWGNPNEGDEVSLALRLALSRLWFTVSLLGDSGRHFLNESIWSLKRLPGDEIWEVTILNDEEKFYTLFVLGLTGEPVGHQHQGSSKLVRSDWGQYIATITSDAKCSIWDHLQCANEEEFVNGVSKAWTQTAEQEGGTGALKRRVAERYVMASLVANSVSGEQMNHRQMAMQTASIPLDGAHRARSNNKINLYLSEHHHVESVHFASSSGQPFHPAVASVQTPHREYFILRENGLQIGCEEDGVSETWMEILGILRDGTACS